MCSFRSVTRGYGHDMSDFEMMTFLVDDAVADFARDGAPRKGMNVLAIDRSFPRAAEPAWERLAAAMDEHPGAVLNPYLERPGSLYLVMDEEDLEIMGVDPGKVYDPEELLDTWGRNLVERVECDGDLRWATLNQALYNLGMDYADVAIDDDSGEVGEPVMDPLPDRPEKGDGEAEL